MDTFHFSLIIIIDHELLIYLYHFGIIFNIMKNTLPSELVSWGEVHRLCRSLASRIIDSGYSPDIVVAIARGGLIPARLVCDVMNIMNLTSIRIEHYFSGSNKQPEATIRYPLCVDVKELRVLIVDDVNDSGDTLQLATDHIQSFHPNEIRTAVMHDKQVTQYRVDYYAKRVIKWRWLVYPWAMHEDISAFIQRLDPRPNNLAEIQQLLAKQFTIKISQKLINEIISE